MPSTKEPAVWVVAKYVSSRVATQPSERLVANFEVTRTLQGSDVSGDRIAVVPPSQSYVPGKSYVLRLFPGGSDYCSCASWREATDEEVAQAAQAVAEAGGTVTPKLVLSGRCMVDGVLFTIDVQADGKFTFLFGCLLPDQEKLLLTSTGQFSKEQVKDLTHRYETAVTGVVPGDAITGGVIGWRDAHQVQHWKSYVPSHAPDELWEHIVKLVRDRGSATPADFDEAIKRIEETYHLKQP